MFLLIQWVNDNPKAWTVISTNLLSDGKLRKAKNLVGRTVGVNWDKRIHSALIVESGSDETELNLKADELANQEAQNLKIAQSSSGRNGRKRFNESIDDLQSTNPLPSTSKSSKSKHAKADDRIADIHTVLTTLESNDASNSIDVTPTVPPDVIEVEAESQVTTPVDLEEQLDALRTKYKDLKKKYKNLKFAHKECLSDESVELVEGSGIRMVRSEIAAVRTMSSSITFFARNLFRRVFTQDDIIGHSLLGRKSTSISNHDPLPSVDRVKRDAIIKFSLKTYGFETTPLSQKAIKERKAAKTSIVKSLSDYVREENAKAKRAILNV